jgi:hypothetical protein
MAIRTARISASVGRAEASGIDTALGLTGVTSPDPAQGFCPDQIRA